MPRVLDAKLDRNPQLRAHPAEFDQLLFVVRRMLAVHRQEAVRVLAENVFKLALAGANRGGHADHDVSPANALFQ